MTRHKRGILELSRLIQPGDLLTLASGNVYPAEGHPVNPDTRRWIPAWLVSVNAGVCIMPVALYAVVAVHRNGAAIWNIDDERMPVQRTLI